MNVELPAELIQLICKNIRLKRDLGNLRLVCKAFSILVLPFLYEEILLWRSPEAITKANLIAQHYGQHVRTIAVCISCPQVVEREFYDERVEPMLRTGALHHHALLERGYNYLLERFGRFNGSDHITMEGICHHLPTILTKTRSVRRFIFLRETIIGLQLSNEQNFPDREDSWMGHDLCTISSAPYDSAYWDHNCLRSIIRPLVQVLAEASSPIRSLEADRLFNIGGMSDSMVQSHIAVCKHLENADFNLDHKPIQFTRSQPWFQEANIAQAFRVADKLQSMKLHFPGSTETFPTILGGCHFPALVKLDLCPRKVLESDLWGFLQYLTSLRSLKLTDTKILKGTWHSLLSQVRTHLQLLDAECAQLRSVIDVEELVVEVLGKDVEAWVCGGELDPFEPKSGEDVEAWKAWLWDCGRETETDYEKSEDETTGDEETEDEE